MRVVHWAVPIFTLLKGCIAFTDHHDATINRTCFWQRQQINRVCDLLGLGQLFLITFAFIDSNIPESL